MNTKELHNKLLAEGCNQGNFAIHPWSYNNHDNYVLEETREGQWIVYYVERGKGKPPIFQTESESEACDYFFKFMMDQEHLHLVCIVHEEKLAVEVENNLHAAGLTPRRNNGGFQKKGDPIWKRVFVVGKKYLRHVSCTPICRLKTGSQLHAPISMFLFEYDPSRRAPIVCYKNFQKNLRARRFTQPKDL